MEKEKKKIKEQLYGSSEQNDKFLKYFCFAFLLVFVVFLYFFFQFVGNL